MQPMLSPGPRYADVTDETAGRGFDSSFPESRSKKIITVCYDTRGRGLNGTTPDGRDHSSANGRSNSPLFMVGKTALYSAKLV